MATSAANRKRQLDIYRQVQLRLGIEFRIMLSPNYSTTSPTADTDNSHSTTPLPQHTSRGDGPRAGVSPALRSVPAPLDGSDVLPKVRSRVFLLFRGANQGSAVQPRPSRAISASADSGPQLPAR
jgi:hypothetical protein